MIREHLHELTLALALLLGKKKCAPDPGCLHFPAGANRRQYLSGRAGHRARGGAWSAASR
jgi:hypothetical protein